MAGSELGEEGEGRSSGTENSICKRPEVGAWIHRRNWNKAQWLERRDPHDWMWDEADEAQKGQITQGFTGPVEEVGPCHHGLDCASCYHYYCYHDFSNEENKAQRSSFIHPLNIY